MMKSFLVVLAILSLTSLVSGCFCPYGNDWGGRGYRNDGGHRDGRGYGSPRDGYREHRGDR
jgi:hypothetical protein